MPGAAAAATGVEALAVSLAGLSAAFAVVAVPVAIVSGIALIISRLEAMRASADITSEHLQALKMGDNTDHTVNQARDDDLPKLEKRLDLLTQERQRIEEINAAKCETTVMVANPAKARPQADVHSFCHRHPPNPADTKKQLESLHVADTSIVR